MGYKHILIKKRSNLKKLELFRIGFIVALLIILVIFIGYIIFMVITDYKPESEIRIKIENNQNADVKKN